MSAPARIPWLELAAYFLGSRALILLIGLLSPLVVVPGPYFEGPRPFPGVFVRWDTGWFLAIANQGYFHPPNEESPVAFFPLYPLLVRAVGWLLPGGTLAAGFLVSHLALLGAVVLLWRLAEEWAAEGRSGLAPGDGSRAVRFLLFGPVSLFFSLIYSESTFLFLVVACLYAAHRQVWWLAGLAGLGAALTRNVGLFLAAPLLIEYFEPRLRAPWFRRDRPLLGAWPCLLPVLGILIWSGYLGWRFGNPLLFAEVQGAWERQLTWPWESFRSRFEPFYDWWFTGHASVALGLFVLALVLRLRSSLVALAGLMLLLNLSAAHLEAIPRLTSVIFPLYLALAALLRRRPELDLPAFALSAALLSFSTVLFVNGYWFT